MCVSDCIVYMMCDQMGMFDLSHLFQMRTVSDRWQMEFEICQVIHANQSSVSGRYRVRFGIGQAVTSV